MISRQGAEQPVFAEDKMINYSLLVENRLRKSQSATVIACFQDGAGWELFAARKEAVLSSENHCTTLKDTKLDVACGYDIYQKEIENLKDSIDGKLQSRVNLGADRL